MIVVPTLSNSVGFFSILRSSDGERNEAIIRVTIISGLGELSVLTNEQLKAIVISISPNVSAKKA